MAYFPPSYSRSRVNRAGQALEAGKASHEDLQVINDWRTSHALPLNVVYMGMKRLANQVDSTALFSQRIKRLSSIETKLRRQSNMNLARMQDIGGCRAVVNRIGMVAGLRERYGKSRIRTHEIVNEFDYVQAPKDDGYRGVHIVFRYTGTYASANDGQLIEMQIRSRLQHAWAMAVETVDHLLDQDLKVGGGDKAWKRFFSLMGTIHGRAEGSPGVAGTPENVDKLRAETRALATQLRVVNQLQGLQTVKQAMGHEHMKDADYFLLELRAKEGLTRIYTFSQREIEAARDRYLKLEEEEDADVVLVRVSDIQQLEQLYPSYFLDTQYFVESLHQFLSASE